MRLINLALILLLIIIIPAQAQQRNSTQLQRSSTQTQQRSSPSSRLSGFEQQGQLESDAAIQRDPNLQVGETISNFLSRTQQTQQSQRTQTQQQLQSQPQQQSQQRSGNSNSQRKTSRQQQIQNIKTHFTIAFKHSKFDYENLKIRLTKYDSGAIILVNEDTIKIRQANPSTAEILRRLALFEPGVKEVQICTD